jgi:hypothetical protein
MLKARAAANVSAPVMTTPATLFSLIVMPSSSKTLYPFEQRLLSGSGQRDGNGDKEGDSGSAAIMCGSASKRDPFAYGLSY